MTSTAIQPELLHLLRTLIRMPRGFPSSRLSHLGRVAIFGSRHIAAPFRSTFLFRGHADRLHIPPVVRRYRSDPIDR